MPPHLLAHLIEQVPRRQRWYGDFLEFLYLCMRTAPKGKSMMLKDFLHSARPCYPTTSSHIG